MKEQVSDHYGRSRRLIDQIADDLKAAGIDPKKLRAADFEPIDEFHFRGRQATLELLEKLELAPDANVLDIGSGLGGVTRTIAEEASAKVTGIDLTQEFCDAAKTISDWVGLSEKTMFVQGDATKLSFSDGSFDGAVTVHVAMNIPDKLAVYKEAHRVLKPGARFGIYDILQGEGGDVVYPTPWAMDASISYLATPKEMASLLQDAGFKILDEEDSTAESYEWLKARISKPKSGRTMPVTTQILFGDIANDMIQNQLLALDERRLLTYRFICTA
ncbi:Sarcosine/dimethylglycine N-methyltransferase [Ruegeria denitrificans]|uniref:Sarcosine/dimethylglycine N-methyltransferase n=1 Tax=Ruegeria denitrificans TaxID=1715692 RepID=A0A0P1IBS8_9RHOB|nr:class I SAM-dependent methyltransferase [Ruegeria denitrificans]CUK03829.1 Sarcosine/dimethylglycine N-methyltransferase [Ruegeria denitrificans]